MNLEFAENTVNIEGLSFRQLALVEVVLREASERGGYQIDIDDYKNIMEGFNVLNIKDVYDLDSEKKIIEENIREIMDKYKRSH